MNTIRRERDSLKMEKNDINLNYQKQIEEFKNRNRELQSESDRIEFKSKSALEETQRMQLKLEKRANEVHLAQSEKL